MNILVVNAGSSTIKFNLFEVKNAESFVSLARGVASNIGNNSSKFKFFAGGEEIIEQVLIATHEQGVELFLEHLKGANFGFDYIAYRVVHGGGYTQVQDVFRTKENVFFIAHKFTKAHADGLIKTVNYLVEKCPHIPQYFDFDTLYHIRTLKPEHYIYALPQDKCRELGIRKYGEHGLSHQYIAEHSTELFGKGQAVISCHLGSGSSISCIYDGKCIDNSMGLTPLAGVVMSTRCGNIDPSTITYMMKEYKLSPDEMDNIMNLQSGIKAICGDGDMQKVIERMEGGDKDALLAFKVTINSYVKSIGGKLLQLGDKIKPDLSNLKIVFTAGIGENSPLVRKCIIDKLKFMGIKLDKKLNNNHKSGDFKISSSGKAQVWILPTNEELVVAKDVYKHLFH